MASDRKDQQPTVTDPGGGATGPRSLRDRADAARSRSPHPRVEVYVNEFTGTMSWRTVQPGGDSRGQGRRVRAGADEPRSAGAGRSTVGHPAADRREQAAALRSAGLDPARAASRGAAPIPTHPAAVSAAVAVHVESLTPEQLQHHLARVAALQSRVAGDVSRGTRIPSAVAARMRSGPAPARAHALTAEHASAARELGRRLPPSPGRRPRTPPAAPPPGPRR